MLSINWLGGNQSGRRSGTGRATGFSTWPMERKLSRARESRRITDGSSRARKKFSGRSRRPRSFVRRGNRIFELNATRQARNLKMDFVICHSVWLRRRWARDSSSSRWSCLPIYHRPNFQRHYPATSAHANATGTLINSIPPPSTLSITVNSREEMLSVVPTV